MPVLKNLAKLDISSSLRVFLSLEAGFGPSALSSLERLEGQQKRISAPAPQTLRPQASAAIQVSRQKLLNAIGSSPDITFVRSYGNLGDDLIYAGTRQLLAEVPYVEISARKLGRARGHTALLSGGGAWNQQFHDFLPGILVELERRFKRVIVMPSSFDVSVDLVRQTLMRTKALIFARERESYSQIRDLCNADIAYDCAFFFDFRPYQHEGKGEGRLVVYRTDPESALMASGSEEMLPKKNRDISRTCDGIDHWLWTISQHRVIETDRAHVMIAAAMLGKRVEYRSSLYHKVPAIAEFSLGEFPVHRQAK